MNIPAFFNPEFGYVRCIERDGDPWFIGKDVTDKLGYANSRKAIIDHVDDEDKGVTKCDTLGGAQDLTIINESGLYSLILSSKLPNARKFKRWVTSEVIPSIKKTGGYRMSGHVDDRIQALANIADKQSEIIKAFADVQNEFTRHNDELVRRIEAAVSVNVATLPMPTFAADPLTLKQTSVEFGINSQIFYQWMVHSGWLRKDVYGNLYPVERLMDSSVFRVYPYTSKAMKSTAYLTKVTMSGRKQLWQCLQRDADFFCKIGAVDIAGEAHAKKAVAKRPVSGKTVISDPNAWMPGIRKTDLGLYGWISKVLSGKQMKITDVVNQVMAESGNVYQRESVMSSVYAMKQRGKIKVITPAVLKGKGVTSAVVAMA